MKRRVVMGVSCWMFFLLVGCGTSPVEPTAPNALPVFAGIPPLAYLAEQIGRDHVKVDVLVQPGQDPHTFEPTPQQILALGRAAIFFKIDMPFETVLLEKIQEGNQRLQVVDATEGIKKRMVDASCCETTTDHDHDHEAAIAKGDSPIFADTKIGTVPDPHVWLSPPLLKSLAENIAAGLCKADPVHERDYQQNLHELVDRIDAVHQRIQQKLAPFRGRSFYVFHPGFGYFADAYGLKEEAVEVGGQAPAAKQLRALIAHAQADGVTTVFVQPQFAPQSAQVVAEAIGGKVVPINGLDKNVIRDIEDIAAKIETAFSPMPGKE